MADYRRFLGAATSEVLPYFGGPFVEAADRRLRLSGPAPDRPGYWRFEIRGRDARPHEPAEAPDLTGLPAVRGYAVAVYLVVAGGTAQRLAIGPEAEPLPFTPLVARRWPSGALLFDSEDLESGVEDQVRRAYQDRQPLGGLAAVPAALRAAYSYAVFLRTARELNVPARPAEAYGALVEIATEGDVAARRLVGRVQARRAAERVPPRAVGGDRVGGDRTAGGDRTVGDAGRARAEHRAAAAVYAAGAALRGLRWLASEQLEVRYEYAGEAFVSIVAPASLQVLDAGICLVGHDAELTLESLPGVIDEAIRTGQLVITGW